MFVVQEGMSSRARQIHAIYFFRYIFALIVSGSLKQQNLVGVRHLPPLRRDLERLNNIDALVQQMTSPMIHVESSVDVDQLSFNHS